MFIGYGDLISRHTPFYEITCSLNELNEKPNHTKNLKVLKFWRKGLEGKRFMKKIYV
jgi:hypothetical protein